MAAPSSAIDIARVLHGAQSFRYLAPAYAGDRLTFAARIADVAVRRKGALTVVVRETDVTNQHGADVMQFAHDRHRARADGRSDARIRRA